MSKIYISRFVIIFLVVLAPLPAFANAIIPLTNIFNAETFASAAVLTFIIVVIETLMLRFWFRAVSYTKHLKRSLIINIASSLVGSFAVGFLLQDDNLPWQSSTYILPMFLFTLLVETQLAWLLYKETKSTLSKISMVVLCNNLLSYLLVFLSQVALFMGFVGYDHYLDGTIATNWIDQSVLEQESAQIYASTYEKQREFGRRGVIRQFNLKSRTWSNLNLQGQGVYPQGWDVKDDLFVGQLEPVNYKNPSLSIIQISSQTLLANIEGNFKHVRISPDLSKLALLEYLGSATERRDQDSYFILGEKCRLKIYDIKSRQILKELDKMTLCRGATWLNATSKIVYTSLRDQKLFNPPKEKLGSRSFGRSYAKRDAYPTDLFLYDLETEKIRSITEGHSPTRTEAQNSFSFLREDENYKNELWLYDLDLKQEQLLFKDRQLQIKGALLSPGERNLLLNISRGDLKAGKSYFALVDRTDTSKRLAVDSSFIYEIRAIP